ncbi:glycosyltransferase [Citrobacter sp. Marseille-Q6884]|uniref:glycosyltransferase n=1 Tax=Citrobacter sp. Marseille-Q6884 TaxID=2956786 RepID=UPI0021B1A1F9|nr:glycosyltransferase [Citrobacter sp. Marseille-Q6884]
MKKIAIVTDSVSHGGVARVALTLLDIFLKNNIDCVIYTVYDENDSEERPEVILNKNRKGYLSRLSEISQDIKKKKYTHVFILTTGKLSVFLSPFLMRTNFKKFVCEHISFESYSSSLQFLKRITYHVYKNVIVLTSHDHNLLQAKNLNVKCIHNPCPFRNDVSCKTENNKRYLAVGHLIPRKGYARLLNIWQRYVHNGGRGTLSIVGDGPLKKKLLAMIDERQIKNVIFLGNIEDMESIYKRHDVLLCSAHAEGLPMTFIEAQYFSLPVISYNIKTGPSEIIVNGKNGYLINNNNETLFVASMFQSEDNKTYKQLAKNSAVLAEGYSYDKIFEKWSLLIDG